MSLEKITLYPDNGPDVEFEGKEVARSSSYNEGRGVFSRWTEIVLYETRGGKFICERLGKSSYPGEDEKSSVSVLNTKEEVHDHLGDGWMAKPIYDVMGWDFKIFVE